MCNFCCQVIESRHFLSIHFFLCTALCFSFRYDTFVLFCFVSVHAVNLAAVCPISPGSLMAYRSFEHPHCPAPHSTRAKQAAQSKQSDVRMESTRQSTVPHEAASSDFSSSQVDVIHSQCSLPATPQMVPNLTWLSHIPANCGKFSLLFSIIIHAVCWCSLISCFVLHGATMVRALDSIQLLRV